MAPDLSTPLQALPHGPEFRFIDQLIALDPGRSGSGEYRIRGDEPFLKGHFPGAPILPGVILLEAGAQLAGVVIQSAPGLPPLRALKLTAIRGAKILGTARPGETLRVQAELIARMENLAQVSVQVFVGPQLVLKAEVTMSGDP